MPSGAIRRPNRSHNRHDCARIAWQIHQKIGMASAPAIFRLPRRMLQISLHRREIEAAQKRAVMQEMGPLALLGIAGEFAPAKREIARALQLNGPGQ